MGKLMTVTIDEISFEKPAGTFENVEVVGKRPEDFFWQWLATDNNRNIANDGMKKLFSMAMPDYLKNGGQTDEEKLLFKKFNMQMKVTYAIALKYFVGSVLLDEFLKDDPPRLLNLSFEFLKCFQTVKGSGEIGYDISRIININIKYGFASLEQAIKRNGYSNLNLRKINKTLHSFSKEAIEFCMNGEEFPQFILPYREYYREKLRYINLEMDLDIKITEQREVKKPVPLNNALRPNRTDIAYFCYYTSETKELVTENSFPSKKAWKEIGERFSKDDTNIQKAYNRIYSNKSERLKKTKTTNINHVIDNMLDDYPKAKKVGLK